MPSHWFILIGFGFSQQQSELIFLSWNNSAPFVPLFYCLIPFILFYCQSFVSLGLQVISNPVGCYNKAFITQLPWFPCPFWSRARTCVWHGILTLWCPLVGLSPAQGSQWLRAGINWWGNGLQVTCSGPIMGTELSVRTFLLWWVVVGTVLGMKRPLCPSSRVGTVLLKVCSSCPQLLDQPMLDCSCRKITFSCVGESTNLNLSFLEPDWWCLKEMWGVVLWTNNTFPYCCFRLLEEQSVLVVGPQMFYFQSESIGSSISLSQ